MFTRQLFGYPDSADFADQLVVVPDVATPAWDLLNRLARCTCSLTPSLRYPRGPVISPATGSGGSAASGSGGVGRFPERPPICLVQLEANTL